MENPQRKSAGTSLTTEIPTGNHGHAKNDQQLQVITQEMINQLFTVMHSTYLQQFKSLFSSTSEIDLARRIWFDSLTKAKITPKQLKRGIDKIQSGRFPYVPMLPQFIDVCQSIELSFTIETAYRECAHYSRYNAEQYQWSHPVIFHIGKSVGLSRLHDTPRQHVWPDFKAAFDDHVKRMARGEKFELPKHLLPNNRPVIAPRILTPEENQQKIKELRALLNIRTVSDKKAQNDSTIKF